MKIIATVNKKGGAGKTTTAHAIGFYLIRQGYKVLFIDLDSQMNLTSAICGTFNALEGKPTAYDIFNKTAASKDLIYSCDNGADIIPGSPKLAMVDAELSDRAGELKRFLKGLSHSYDFVILDTPPNMGVLTTAALIGATDTVICSGVDLFSIQGFTGVLQQIGVIKQKANKDLNVAGVLLTRYDRRSTFTKSVHEQIKEMCSQMGVNVFDTVIRENVSIKEAQAGAVDVFSYAPRSNGAQDYTAFMGELME